MKRARGVIIGAGFFAGHQAEAWNRIPSAEITAVADVLPGKALEFAERHRIPRFYESAAEMIERERPDFVDIATRPEAHLEMVRLAARSGAHAICQKPMAPTEGECVAMCEACAAASVRLLIHENWRWQPWYREAKRLYVQLGKLFQLAFQWRTGDGRGSEPYAVQPYFRQMPRLLIYESLVHILDTFRFLEGEVETVFCQNRRINPVIAGEDQSLIQLTFRSGALGLIDANRVSGPAPAPVAMGGMVLEGDAGRLRVTPEGQVWVVAHGQVEAQHPFDIPAHGYKGDSVHAAQRHMIDCLLDGKRCESEGEDYLKTVALVEACYRSARDGAVAKLPG